MFSLLLVLIVICQTRYSELFGVFILSGKRKRESGRIFFLLMQKWTELLEGNSNVFNKKFNKKGASLQTANSL